MIQRIQFLAKNYKALQGLALIPYGVLGLFSTVWSVWLRPLFFPQGMSVAGVFLYMLIEGGIVIGLVRLITQYYRRTFGQINIPSLSGPHPDSYISAWALICIVLLICGTVLDLHLHLYVCLFGVAVAATLFLRWYYMGKILHYYLVLAAIVLALSFLPMLNGTIYNLLFLHGPDQYGYFINPGIGILLTTVGLLDHLALLRNISLVRGIARQNYGQIE